VGRRLVAVIALLCFTGCLDGCSWTATIGRTDGLDNEAEIEHSDADALYLLSRNGTLHRVPRRSVRSIDHPGNVEAIVGAILLGFGIAIAVDEWDKNRDDAAGIAAVYGIPGLTMMLEGGIRYIMSLRAAWAFQTADAPLEEQWPSRPPPPPPPTTYPPPPGLSPPAAPPTPPAPPPPAQPQPEDEQPQVVPGAT
jgi:hypothetical protein